MDRQRLLLYNPCGLNFILELTGLVAARGAKERK